MTERQFLVDINPNIDLPEYNLVLYSLYEQPITELYNITNFNIKPFFIGIDEISFNIPMTRNEADGQIVRNEIYDMVDGEYYIKLNDSKFFVINGTKEKTNDDGFTYKEVNAYSREAELNQKRLVDYKASSRMLYDRENTMLEDENGQLIERGILNYIFNHITKAWAIGTVDERVVSLTNQGISRELNFSNSSLIQVFQELQKTYNCVFKFNTITQVIDVESSLNYDLNIEDIANSPQYKGLYISDENFIKNMSKNIEYDKVKTRLFLYGKDNVSIQNIHPTGQPYIDNLSTFKTTKFMTQELIDGLNAYELLVQNANPNFTPLLNQLQTKNAELEELYNKDDAIIANKGLVALKRELSLVQTNIDTRVANLAIIRETIAGANGTDLSGLHTEMKTIQTEIDEFESQKTNINSLIATKEDQIASKKNEIVSVENQIQGIRDSLSVQANLVPHLVKELDKFIRVETYNDSNFTENNIMELYEEGKKNLAKISQPSIQFDVNVVDFLSIIECQHTWDKFVLGDIVLLENKNIGFSYYVRLVGYEHSPDSNSLNLKFSNTNSFDDATLWIKDLLEQMNNTTSTLDFNKYKWDKTENMQDRISKMVDEKLEEARQNILNAVGQKHLFDDSGLWLYKENSDGTINKEQIRAINNTIALTENNWQTVGTAITPKGVVAPSIYGKLGRFALVQANKIEVGGDFDYDWSTTQPTPPYQVGQTWLDNGVSKICANERLEGAFNPDDWKITIASHVDNVIDEVNNTITTAFSDSSITNIEANSLKLLRDSLVKEADNAISIANNIGLDNHIIADIIRDSYKDVFRPNATTLNIIDNIMTINYSKYVGFNGIVLSKGDYDENDEDYGYYVGSGSVINVEFDIISNNIWNNEIYMNFIVDDGYSNYTIEEKISHGQTGHIKFNAVANSDYVRFLLVPDHDEALVNPSDPIWDSAGVFKIANLQISSPPLSEIESAISNVNIESGKYINKTNYPIPVSELDRINLTSAFESLGIALANLYEKINKKRDSNSIKQNFYYNKTKITEQEGIEVYDNLGNRVLQTGGFDSDGNGKKDMYGHVAYHADGGYSALVRDGFLRKWPNGSAKYLNDVDAINGETLNVVIEGITYIDRKPPPVRVYLPTSMTGREIKFSISLRGFEIASVRDVDIEGNHQWTETYLNINSINLSSQTPYVDIEGYTEHNGLHGGTVYQGIQFLLLAIGS